MTTLIYIGGYGRSGSTLVESLLTARPEIVACGEIASVARKGTLKRRNCTCGQHPNECPVWKSCVPFFAKPQSRRNHQDLTLALLDRVAGEYSLLVDSSKTAWRSAFAPIAFRRKLQKDFRLLLVVRDPRGVCWSVMSQPKGGASANVALRCGVTALGWCLANLSCEMFGWMYPSQYQRVRYEDLVRAPREVLQQVFTNVLPDFQGQLDEIGSNNNRHQLRGNPTRHRPLSFSDVRPDVRWTSEMPLTYRRLVTCLTWPLRYRYGY